MNKNRIFKLLFALALAVPFVSCDGNKNLSTLPGDGIIPPDETWKPQPPTRIQDKGIVVEANGDEIIIERNPDYYMIYPHSVIVGMSDVDSIKALGATHYDFHVGDTIYFSGDVTEYTERVFPDFTDYTIEAINLHPPHHDPLYGYLFCEKIVNKRIEKLSYVEESTERVDSVGNDVLYVGGAYLDKNSNFVSLYYKFLNYDGVFYKHNLTLMVDDVVSPPKIEDGVLKLSMECRAKRTKEEYFIDYVYDFAFSNTYYIGDYLSDKTIRRVEIDLKFKRMRNGEEEIIRVYFDKE